MNKIEIEDLFPVSDDIKKFNAALTKEVETAAALLEKEPSEANWRNLRDFLLAKITAFNARRPLEPGLTTIHHFEKRITGSRAETDLVYLFTESEKLLATSMEVVKVVGKHGRIVPVLLKKNFVVLISLLNRKREECKIPSQNPFVFAKGENSSMHGSVTTKRVVNIL